MTAPATIPSSHPVLTEALGRLHALTTAAGMDDWSVPLPMLDAVRFDGLVRLLHLDPGEQLATALVLAAEAEPTVTRMVARAQAPVGAARPLAGLMAALFGREGLTVPGLLAGAATRSEVLVWGEETAPLAERSLSMPAWLVAALSGLCLLPPTAAPLAQPSVLLPEAALTGAAELALWLADQDGGFDSGEGAALLVIRASCPAEGEAVARAVAQAMQREPCRLDTADAPGLACWLAMMGRLAMVHRSAGPGETIALDSFDRLAAPLLVVAGPDGQIGSVRSRREWTVPLPAEAERAQLWSEWGLPPEEATEAAARYRQSAGRIAEIGRSLRHGPGKPSLVLLAGALQTGTGRIDALARRADVPVRRVDIVLPPALGEALDRLRDRIRLRNRLHDGLGDTLAARYRPGVRALFTGSSGTGKTLAVHWLAREAGLPCYRVDLAQLTSKWIGETEKNLSQLLDAAEEGDVLLFFDEADSLFGARTDVSDANDRYANAQTNFLLQRIEDFAGVALLATNSRDRFDPAFVRRLGHGARIPAARSRRAPAVVGSALGGGHALSPAQLDRIAVTVDLTGGHVRNVVLSAAAQAQVAGRKIVAADLISAIAEEYANSGAACR